MVWIEEGFIALPCRPNMKRTLKRERSLHEYCWFNSMKCGLLVCRGYNLVLFTVWNIFISVVSPISLY